MRLVPLSETHHICETYDVVGVRSLPSLLDLITSNSDAKHRAFVTLDDLGQASYTSMHATMRWELDPVEADEYELEGPALFPGRLANFRRRLAETAGVLPDRTLRLDGVEAQELAEANASLVSVLDREVHLSRVPVTSAADVLAAFPNGYFDDDFSPVENHAIATLLEREAGFELFGIGASYLAFRRIRTTSTSALEGVLAKLTALYEPDLTDILRPALTWGSVLVLRYATG